MGCSYSLLVVVVACVDGDLVVVVRRPNAAQRRPLTRRPGSVSARSGPKNSLKEVPPKQCGATWNEAISDGFAPADVRVAFARIGPASNNRSKFVTATGSYTYFRDRKTVAGNCKINRQFNGPAPPGRILVTAMVPGRTAFPAPACFPECQAPRRQPGTT